MMTREVIWKRHRWETDNLEKATCLITITLVFNRNEFTSSLKSTEVHMFNSISIIRGGGCSWINGLVCTDRFQIISLARSSCSGMAADIAEIFEAFRESKVMINSHLTYAILAVWNWSLLQFCLAIGASHKSRRTLRCELELDSTLSQSWIEFWNWFFFIFNSKTVV